MRKAKELKLINEHREYLENVISTSTDTKQIMRAKILLEKASGRANTEIARILNINYQTVRLWVNKYLSLSSDTPISKILCVSPGRGPKNQYSSQEKEWISSLSLLDARDFGMKRSKWTNSEITNYINLHAEEAGFNRLKYISPSGVYKIIHSFNGKKTLASPYVQNQFQTKIPDFVIFDYTISYLYDDNGNLYSFHDDDIIKIYDFSKNDNYLTDFESDDIRSGSFILLYAIDLKRKNNTFLIRSASNITVFTDFLTLIQSNSNPGKIGLNIRDFSIYRSNRLSLFLNKNPGRFEFLENCESFFPYSPFSSLFKNFLLYFISLKNPRTRDSLISYITHYCNEVFDKL